MRCGHLFNGIGGFALAASWMGWENKMHCEIDPFCNKVMNYYFPNSYQYEDIKTADFTIFRDRIDILTGGFPCQPYSTVGKRKGTADDRHLWPFMLTAIQHIRPHWVVGENVRGLVNWNGGMVFDEVQSDLEAAHYEVVPFLLPACAVSAPHRRDRIWFIAYAKSVGERSGTGGQGGDKTNWQFLEGAAPGRDSNDFGEGGITTNPKGGDGYISKGPENPQKEVHIIRAGIAANAPDTEGVSRREQANENDAIAKSGKAWFKPGGGGGGEYAKTDWQNFPTQPPLCTGNDGLPAKLDGITFSKWRNESLKAAGNAIVPQVAYEIFKVIDQLKTKQND